ncbi:hypothetical protein ACLOJK_023273 [Asimina triloba]
MWKSNARARTTEFVRPSVGDGESWPLAGEKSCGGGSASAAVGRAGRWRRLRLRRWEELAAGEGGVCWRDGGSAGRRRCLLAAAGDWRDVGGAGKTLEELAVGEQEKAVSAGETSAALGGGGVGGLRRLRRLSPERQIPNRRLSPERFAVAAPKIFAG